MENKETILNKIMQNWSQNKVLFRIGGESDLSIDEKFVDAKWSTGKKEINYQASVLLDEETHTILMWEKTVEKGSGFSFGTSSESSFQTGATLFRKVKSVQYGPDGKAFEYELDLGAITKAVKDAAKAGGWKFKTVLSKAKASC